MPLPDTTKRRVIYSPKRNAVADALDAAKDAFLDGDDDAALVWISRAGSILTELKEAEA